MNIFVKELELKKIHGIFDYEFKFSNGINIIFGKNGSGKSTILHIIANILNGDFERFVFLKFESIRVLLSDNTELLVEPNQIDNDKIEVTINSVMDSEDLNAEDLPERHITISKKETYIKLKSSREREARFFDGEIPEPLESEKEVILPTAYFPSFRTMIDAWSARDYPYNYPRFKSRRRTSMITGFARTIFGDFVPEITYPSIMEIEIELSNEIRKAQTLLAEKDRELLSTAFLNTLSTVSIENKDNLNLNRSSIESLILEIKDKIQVLKEHYPNFTDLDNSINIYKELEDFLDNVKIDVKYSEIGKKILGTYNELLGSRSTFQTKIFTSIDNYLISVNSLLENKNIEILQEDKKGYPFNLLGVRFLDDIDKGFKTLSSGERQILTLFYASSKMSNQNIVLIDEPEISLHVDWQRTLLKDMADQLGECQIIVCTHSPIIGADHDDHLIEVKLKTKAK